MYLAEGGPLAWYPLPALPHQLVYFRRAAGRTLHPVHKHLTTVSTAKPLNPSRAKLIQVYGRYNLITKIIWQIGAYFCLQTLGENEWTSISIYRPQNNFNSNFTGSNNRCDSSCADWHWATEQQNTNSAKIMLYPASTHFFSLPKFCKIIYSGIRDAHRMATHINCRNPIKLK